MNADPITTDTQTDAVHKADIAALNTIEKNLGNVSNGPAFERVMHRMSRLHEIEAVLGGRRLEPRRLHVVYANSDRTGGRGPMVPIRYCESPATAERLVKWGGLGEGAYVVPTRAFDVGLTIYAPVALAPITKEDRETDERNRKRNEVRERMLAAGFTDVDIALAAGGAS